MGRNINPQNGAKMNMILFENPPTVYFERIEDYEEKSTPWRRVPPTYKGSSTKSGRNKKQIRRDRKRVPGIPPQKPFFVFSGILPSIPICQ